MRRRWIIGGTIVVIAAALLLGAQYVATRGGSGGPTGLPAGVVSQLTGGAASSAATSDGVAPQPTKLNPAGAQAPAAPGAVLSKLAGAPPKTIVRFDVGYLSSADHYLITFQPFGFGPDAAGQPTLVVKIVSAAGLGGAASSAKLAGLTTVARISPASATAYSKGGTYTALMSLAVESTGLVPRLSPPMSATAARQAIAASEAASKKK
jgi:hypothetical protein